MKTSTQIITTNSDDNADGIIDSRYLNTKTYDQRGNLLTNVSETDDNADGTIDYRYSNTNTYDQWGNQLASKYEADKDGDSNVKPHTSCVIAILNQSNKG